MTMEPAEELIEDLLDRHFANTCPKCYGFHTGEKVLCPVCDRREAALIYIDPITVGKFVQRQKMRLRFREEFGL